MFVAIGGAIGASLRHGCSLLAVGLGGGEEAWLLAVNLIGSFGLGFIFATIDPAAPRCIDVESSADEIDPDPTKDRLGAFGAVGLIGGFTTYSGLAMHLVDRFQSDRWLEGGITLTISLGVGLAMLTLGVRGGRRWSSFASGS